MTEEKNNFALADQNDYLTAGIGIGTKTRSPGMKRFIYKIREGLFRLDLKTVDRRVSVAANLLAHYEPQEIVVTASRVYAIAAAKKFATIINAKFMEGRVTPGIFTNPNRDDFMEPRIIFISDSRNEKQAIKEASKINIPIIAVSDTDNSTKFVDLIIPANNRGRRSLGLVYFLLAREYLKSKGTIKTNEEFQYKIEDFEAAEESKQRMERPEGNERPERRERSDRPFRDRPFGGQRETARN
jgi:small subunit ribosomal protein S2